MHFWTSLESSHSKNVSIQLMSCASLFWLAFRTFRGNFKIHSAPVMYNRWSIWVNHVNTRISEANSHISPLFFGTTYEPQSDLPYMFSLREHVKLLYCYLTVFECRLDPDTTTEAQGSLSNTEKKIRTIRKKLQQAEALSVRQAAGEKLTQPELEKLSKTTVW